MIVWTIQPEKVYEILKKDGVFFCDENLSTYGEDFKDAYNWIVKQMDKRGIKHPKNLSLPIWAWHTRNWKHKKPDLRESGYDSRGKKSVLLEIEIPDEEVLLSDYDEWHFVLNDSYNDDSMNEKEFDKMQNDFEKLPFEEQKKIKEKSWEKIFDVEPFENEWRYKGKYIQACFWKIRFENVKKIQYFTCR